MLQTNKGAAVVIALLSLLILATLGASVLFSTQAEITTTYNFKRLTQARYAAEAGAQSTANWLIYNYTAPTSFASYDMTKSPVEYSGQPVVLSALSGVSANYPDSAVQTAFNTALQAQPVSGMDVSSAYSTTATLQTMRVVTVFGSATLVPLQSWLIRSQATVGSSQARVEVTTTIERFGSPVFPYAAFAVSATCHSLQFGGGANTDSFDSTLGTYATTQQFSSGNVGTNGNSEWQHHGNLWDGIVAVFNDWSLSSDDRLDPKQRCLRLRRNRHARVRAVIRHSCCAKSGSSHHNSKL